MKIGMMAAMAENRVIGNDSKIPWKVKGEQLLFKAMTFNQWLLVGRKTFEAMGILPDRKYAVVSRLGIRTLAEGVVVFPSIDNALSWLGKNTDLVMVAGGGEVYKQCIRIADTIHLSTIRMSAEGDTYFPDIPPDFTLAFEQNFVSNEHYTYQIWERAT